MKERNYSVETAGLQGESRNRIIPSRMKEEGSALTPPRVSLMDVGVSRIHRCCTCRQQQVY